VSELEPAITGKEFMHQLLEVLNRINTPPSTYINFLIGTLQQAEKMLAHTDLSNNNDATLYQPVVHLLQTLDTPFEENKLFQTDSTVQVTSGGINKQLQDQIAGAVIALKKLSAPPAQKNIQEFTDRFVERYEEKEMPLLEVLDTETGIGYLNLHQQLEAPLVESILLPEVTTARVTYHWGEVEKMLSKKLQQALAHHRQQITITDEDLELFTATAEDLPPSMSVLFRLINGNTIYIENTGGSSALSLLGRFAHANPGINKLLCEVATIEQEKNPDVLFAEIVHLPERRTGNILLHPVFRNYEIPYLAKSSLPEEQQIQAKDIYISVQQKKIVLRSKKLNKQIIPRLSTAHNYSYQSLPVYQFLCDMQIAYRSNSLHFSWSSLQLQYSFLPRVTYHHTILSLATWRFLKKDTAHFFTLPKQMLETTIVNFKIQWQLPRWVVLADGDNELLIDFDNETSRRIWLEAIKNKETFILKEFLQDQDTGVVNVQNQSYCNQLVAILIKNSTCYTTPSNTPQIITQPIAHTFTPGSEWLYYKIYCGEKTADTILVDSIRSLTETLIKKGSIDKWFFIRYYDPHFHLRLRFHLTNTNDIGIIMQATSYALQRFEHTRHIWKLQIDTYERELKRYGSNTIEQAETLFYEDSLAAVHILNELKKHGGNENARWLCALLLIDDWLVIFKYTLPEKLSLLTSLKNSYGKEFGIDKALKRQLDDKFRQNKQSIESVLNRSVASNHIPRSCWELLRQKNIALQPTVQHILQLKAANRLAVSYEHLTSSYIHMLVNRLILSQPRLHELVLYDSLFRYYRSQLAIQGL
jgi:lantibiotic biosynthesis protein